MRDGARGAPALLTEVMTTFVVPGGANCGSLGFWLSKVVPKSKSVLARSRQTSDSWPLLYVVTVESVEVKP